MILQYSHRASYVWYTIMLNWVTRSVLHYLSSFRSRSPWKREPVLLCLQLLLKRPMGHAQQISLGTVSLFPAVRHPETSCGSLSKAFVECHSSARSVSPLSGIYLQRTGLGRPYPLQLCCGYMLQDLPNVVRGDVASLPQACKRGIIDEELLSCGSVEVAVLFQNYKLSLPCLVRQTDNSFVKKSTVEWQRLHPSRVINPRLHELLIRKGSRSRELDERLKLYEESSSYVRVS